MAITQPFDAIRNQVYSILVALNAETSLEYPDHLFDGLYSGTFPVTVYNVEIKPTLIMNKKIRRVRVITRVDHFAPTPQELSTLSNNTLEQLVSLFLACDTDSESTLPNGIIRRSQRFTGLLDLQEERIYKE